MGKTKKPLKAMLQTHSSRMKLKEKAAQAVQTAGLMAKKQKQGKPKTTLVVKRKPTMPFRATDKILLIGEGNFSFARALVCDAPTELAHLPPKNVTATAYDTEQECYEKYPGAEDIVRDLKALGVEVHFSVDATKLDRFGAFKGRTWDKIVWNFPHAGKGIADQDRNILSNQLLILGFLRSASGFLVKGPIPQIFTPKKKRKPDEEEEDEQPEEPVDEESENITQVAACRGSILITLRNVVPYTQWDVPRLAKNPPAPASSSAPQNPSFTLLRSFYFDRRAWKGYEHRMTKGERAHGTGRTGEGGEDRTWEFCLESSLARERRQSKHVT
ncbi:hypothetical protein FB45DRAFT_844316 [Roridomyces roridus]|uniref:25S rRNA (uridine-N(3))-methyltransferase BMT5-like domain-containing protein n=1 Tax=Roridomyces roridus TaxID=1738132 RepID=A0AAD7FCJ2_9AGAR|nr:hypothetical protein FB45DRAFT_844316 [Roridomyces roridus]